MKTIFGVAMVLLVIWLGALALDRSAKNECQKWAVQAEEYEGFYLTRAEAEQCDYYAIQVNAPIR